MQTKLEGLDLKQLAKDKQTQEKFSKGLDKKTTNAEILAHEFSASGGKVLGPK